MASAIYSQRNASISMSESICYLNGEWQPLVHAKVSVLDRGFIFGDGIYEVIPVFAGAPFRMAEHIRRLETNLLAVSMLNPFAIDDWKSLVGELIARNRHPSRRLQ